MAENLNILDAIAKEFNIDISQIDLRSYSPVVLAYIGDVVLEIVVRSLLVCKYTNKVDRINSMCSNIVRAEAQAKMVKYFLENDIFNANEKAIYKRGRNASTKSSAKNATISEYKMSTGFEALLGYLYLNKETDRLLEIIKTGIDVLNHKEDEKDE